jgi:hypothetical protein
MAIDVAVTSPLNQSSMFLVSPCEEYATNKHRKYDVGFQGQAFFFSALVLETLGAINAEGDELMRQIFRFAAKRVGREFSSFCGRGWARLSCNLQRCVSQMILARTEGASGQRAPVVSAPAHVVPPSLALAQIASVVPSLAQAVAPPAPQAHFVPVVDLLSSQPSPLPHPVTPVRPGPLPYWMSSPPVDLPLCLATPPVKHSVLGATKCLTRGCPYFTFSECGFCDVLEARCWMSHYCTLPHHRPPPEIPSFTHSLNDSLKGVCGLSGCKEGNAHAQGETKMQPKQLATASPAAHGPFACSPTPLPPTPSLPPAPSPFLRVAPLSLARSPTHIAHAPQGPRVDLGSSSFGHTGLSPYLSVGTRRGVGGGWEGVS